jgi:hypothetical protein
MSAHGFSERPRGIQQRATLRDLIQTMAAMQHIDELFLAFTRFTVQRIGAQVAQVWAAQVNQLGQPFPGVRGMACLNRKLPQYMVISPHVAAVAEYTLQARDSSPPQLVDVIFPPDVATPLQAYGLNLCASSYFSSNALLPPASTDFSAKQPSTPLTIVLLLFFQQVPHQNALLSINNMFQHVLLVAQNHGLLLAAPTNGRPAASFSQPLSKQDGAQSLFELIPHQVEDPMDNPFAASVIIADEHIRRFYTAIDGRRNIHQICMLKHLDKKKASAIVQILLAQHRIQLYTLAGQVVENPLFLEDSDLCIHEGKKEY